MNSSKVNCKHCAVFPPGLETHFFVFLFLHYIGFLLHLILVSPKDTPSPNPTYTPQMAKNAHYKKEKQLRSLERVSPPASMLSCPEVALS